MYAKFNIQKVLFNKTLLSFRSQIINTIYFLTSKRSIDYPGMMKHEMCPGLSRLRYFDLYSLKLPNETNKNSQNITFKDIFVLYFRFVLLSKVITATYVNHHETVFH